ncbi:MAG TPA: sigma factor, partial [Phycisphaerales bacterium]|nr:sigma factor [Phycisphaerales bacterium]
MTADDRQLLRRTHAGHEASARELWQRHAGWMLPCARGALGRRHAGAAEDIVQSVFCRILQLDRRTIRRVRDVRPWLARILRTQALNHVRSAGRAARRESLAAPPERHDAASHPDLAAALGRLPRRHREVLHL